MEIIIPIELFVMLFILILTVYFLRNKLKPALVDLYGTLHGLCSVYSTSAHLGAGRGESQNSSETEDKYVMTIETGIKHDSPLRESRVAQLAQNCQKCGKAITIGDMITKYPCGWCHESCIFLPVGQYN